MKESGFRKTLILLAILSTLLLVCLAANAETSGKCGDNLTWTLDDAGTLTISGAGEMYDYRNDPSDTDAPWIQNEWYENIKKIVINQGVTSIGSYAFIACESVSNATIPSSVTCIGNNAFDGCSSLRDVTISSSVTSIGDEAFSCCRGLSSIRIPSSVTSIGSNAFYECYNLKSAWFENGVSNIGIGMFAGCGKLNSVTIPSSVTSIGASAFYGCSFLSYVTIPSSVTDIGNEAFSCCSRLNNVTVPSSVTSIGYQAFYDCTSLTNLTISEGVTSIGEKAFMYCPNLANVTIPSSVTSIGSLPFYACANLSAINVDVSNREFSSVDGVLFNADHTVLLAYPGGKSGSYSIPNGVTSIRNAFNHCSGLTSVMIPNSVTSIGENAFRDCEHLTSVTIPKSVTSIGFAAFSSCSSLSDIYYSGTETEKAQITISNVNDPLLNATWHYASTTSYTVTFDANGGTGTPSSQTKEEDVALTLSSYQPSKKYIIQYNANGGSVSPASKNVDCSFNSWNTSADGSGDSYAPGGSYTANADVTLYAQWTDPVAGTLATPSRSGYDFDGWYTSASGGTKITDSTTVTNNMTVYAHWTEPGVNPYNLGDETYSFENYSDSDMDGHCFGMSMTSAGYYNNLLDIRKIGGNASTPLYSFGQTPIVTKPICYYAHIQGTYRENATVAGGSAYLNGWNDIDSDWREVVSYVRNHQYDGTGLLQIGFKKGRSGHAINFLRYENVNGQDRIYAYDNNFPTQETYFYRDSSGNVRQAPVQTYDVISCIALRDVRIYFRNVKNFDSTHVLYMPKDAAIIEGYSYSYLEGGISGEEYVMYEIPADQDGVIITPKRDNADFIYMDTEYSFGKITDETRGELVFATMNEGAVVDEADFRIYEVFGEADLTLPSSLQSIEESAFEGIDATSVFVPDSCTSIGAYAFKNAAVTKIRIPEKCTVADTAFEGCDSVEVFGTPGSAAEAFCDAHDNCIFVAE